MDNIGATMQEVQLLLREKEIIGYAVTGGFPDASTVVISKEMFNLLQEEFTPSKFLYEDGEIIPNPDFIPEQRNKVLEVQLEIDNLKAQLSETDYQIIKTYEYQLMGMKTEYDLKNLHIERQEIRDRINELESMIEDRG